MSPQTYIPLATVLLAISEQSFFLNMWHIFLVQNLLPNLRVRALSDCNGLTHTTPPSAARRQQATGHGTGVAL